MENRSQWGTRVGFLLAAMGSAIGLGNIWRFPATAYESGGGAFIVPYLFALLTAGIPLLIMEYTIGHRYRGSAPKSFATINKKMEWIGWWQVLVAFVISTYYAVIIAWALMYAYYSIGLSWGSDPTAFFVGDFLNLADPGQLGGLVPKVLIPLVIVWAIVLGTLSRGVKKGIEVANKIFIPALVVLFLIIVVRAVTLPGAMNGLNSFFEPDWSRILDAEVWIAAYGQIFFSLSIAFAIMVTYASYLPRKSDITNNAFITGFANSSFEILAGIGVFSAVGFMAFQYDTTVAGLAAEKGVGGIGLAFMVFPEIISQIPGIPGLFGVLFFASLVLAGFSSLISISETYVAAVSEKFNISRQKSVIFGGGIAAILSLLYATRGGLNILDTVDHFINSYGVALAGLVEVVAVVWFAKELKALQEHANSSSDVMLAGWWRFCLGVITPIVLGFQMVQNLTGELAEPYEGYPTDFLIYFGWVVAFAAILIGFAFSMKKWPQGTAFEDPTKPNHKEGSL
ncbi:sodium-dependent transporter [Salimicrobium jeotgali]|uniref:Sodium-dependent transporter n=1 Tax=Salimicrobium jeotgali TaxID=1230341 RepID=K2FQG2_9BACI|nr:sodium-dependent transporter [Salimicrobium jeotgali]AKG03996.1 sodium-dependent transporter [Salimicrobium jeotgali]EKE33036.1 sodium-dependent transporter family protein [Salimicrobium jeotgali]MBM7694970.1 NSS family neurotransmitter:Na+ symporter [Salimicrobium jeotgali]